IILCFCALLQESTCNSGEPPSTWNIFKEMYKHYLNKYRNHHIFSYVRELLRGLKAGWRTAIANVLHNARHISLPSSSALAPSGKLKVQVNFDVVKEEADVAMEPISD